MSEDSKFYVGKEHLWEKLTIEERIIDGICAAARAGLFVNAIRIEPTQFDRLLKELGRESSEFTTLHGPYGIIKVIKGDVA